MGFCTAFALGLFFGCLELVLALGAVGTEDFLCLESGLSDPPLACLDGGAFPAPAASALLEYALRLRPSESPELFAEPFTNAMKSAPSMMGMEFSRANRSLADGLAFSSTVLRTTRRVISLVALALILVAPRLIASSPS